MQPWVGTGDRRVFFVVVHTSIDLAMHFTGPSRTPVLEVLSLLIEFDRTQSKGTLPPDSYDLYSWGGIRLPDYIRMYEVPQPGIIIAAHRSLQSSGSAFGVRKLLESNKDHPYGQRVERFLASAEAKFEPVPIAKLDVFLSHSVKDAPIAKGLVEGMERAGLTTFLAARDVPGGSVWTEELRDSLASSRVGFLLLTPNSLNSGWVMCEVGALWALGKTIVPALMGVRPERVPEILSSFQFKMIGEGEAQQEQLIADVARLCMALTEVASTPTLPPVDLSQKAKKVEAPAMESAAPEGSDVVGTRGSSKSKKRSGR